MSPKTIKVLKISITSERKKDILEYVQKYLNKNPELRTGNLELETKPLIIVTPNPEQIVYAQQDKHFASILNWADLALPDGIGIVIAARFLHPATDNRQLVSQLRRIPGVEFMEDLVALAAEKGYDIGLIGGRANLAVKTLECLRSRHPKLRGFTMGDFEVGQHGEEDEDTKTLRYKDTKSKEEKTIFGASVSSLISQYFNIFRAPLVIFIALGAPKQEYFIEAISRQLSVVNQKSPAISHQSSDSLEAPLVLMAVGGSFDILSGGIHRAPSAIRRLGSEWLWRLLRQPWRLQRQLSLAKFAWLVLREKLHV